MWIKFNEFFIQVLYFQCKAGLRNVRMFSHLAAIVWYLSVASHENRDKFGVRDWSVHQEDVAPNQISDSSSDSDKWITCLPLQRTVQCQ